MLFASHTFLPLSSKENQFCVMKKGNGNRLIYLDLIVRACLMQSVDGGACMCAAACQHQMCRDCMGALPSGRVITYTPPVRLVHVEIKLLIRFPTASLSAE